MRKTPGRRCVIRLAGGIFIKIGRMGDIGIGEELSVRCVTPVRKVSHI